MKMGAVKSMLYLRANIKYCSIFYFSLDLAKIEKRKYPEQLFG
jgi:hypothetical protein